MKKSFITSILLLITSICLAQELDTQKLDSLFDLLESHNKFMGSLSVTQNGKTLYQKTIGFVSIEDSIKSNHSTKYRVGSISKMFTASLLLKAVEENKLALDDNLDQFYPEIVNADNITIKNLLNHSSGIHDFTRNEDYLDWNQTQQSKDNMLERIAGFESDFEPNSKSEYSNSNFVLLTFILEDLYKTSFAKLLETKIILPVYLKNTAYGQKINPKANEALSYSFLGKWNIETETDMSIPQGAGAIISTPEDLNNFITALFNEKIISKNNLELMKSIKNGYGLGLFKFPYNDKWSYGHTGGIDGFQSVTSFFPDDQLAISLTGNGINYDKNDILLAVLGSFYEGKFDLPEFKSINITEEELENFLGTYSSEQIPPKITITREDFTLLAQATGQSAFPLEPISNNTFVFKQAGVKIEFNLAENLMILKQGGKEFLFHKE